jgi:hypothetical protein
MDQLLINKFTIIHNMEKDRRKMLIDEVRKSLIKDVYIFKNAKRDWLEHIKHENENNNTFEYTTMDKDIINGIIDRQKAANTIYENLFDMTILHRLCEIVQDKDDEKTTINEYMTAIQSSDEYPVHMKVIMIKELFVKFITNNIHELYRNSSLTQAEKNTLNFIEYKPLSLVIIDDYVDTINELMHDSPCKENLAAIFNQNKYSNITVLLFKQSKEAVDLHLELNYNNIIFGDEESIENYFSDVMDDLSNAERNLKLLDESNKLKSRVKDSIVIFDSEKEKFHAFTE